MTCGTRARFLRVSLCCGLPGSQEWGAQHPDRALNRSGLPSPVALHKHTLLLEELADFAFVH